MQNGYKVTGVYIMQSSNGLCKIGKANNVEIRRTQLEQGANMFNLGERVTVKIIKFYPVISESVAFALEGYLHEHFAGCQSGASKEVFIVDIREVVKIADIWASAFAVAQSIHYQDMMLREANEAKYIDNSFSFLADGFSEED